MNITWLKILTGRKLAIYKRGRGVKLGSIEKQLQLSGQSGVATITRLFMIGQAKQRINNNTNNASSPKNKRVAD